MKYPFKSLLLAATVLAAASCAKDDTQSGGEETAGPVIVNASPAAIGGEIILKLKTEASGIVEKSRMLDNRDMAEGDVAGMSQSLHRRLHAMACRLPAADLLLAVIEGFVAAAVEGAVFRDRAAVQGRRQRHSQNAKDFDIRRK